MSRFGAPFALTYVGFRSALLVPLGFVLPGIDGDPRGPIGGLTLYAYACTLGHVYLIAVGAPRGHLMLRFGLAATVLLAPLVIVAWIGGIVTFVAASTVFPDYDFTPDGRFEPVVILAAAGGGAAGGFWLWCVQAFRPLRGFDLPRGPWLTVNVAGAALAAALFTAASPILAAPEVRGLGAGVLMTLFALPHTWFSARILARGAERPLPVEVFE